MSSTYRCINLKINSTIKVSFEVLNFWTWCLSQITSRFMCPAAGWLFSLHHQAIKSSLPILHHISKPCTEVLCTGGCCDSVILAINRCRVTLGAVGYPAAAPEWCSSSCQSGLVQYIFPACSNSLSVLFPHGHLTKPKF